MGPIPSAISNMGILPAPQPGLSPDNPSIITLCIDRDVWRIVVAAFAGFFGGIAVVLVHRYLETHDIINTEKGGKDPTRHP